MNTAPWRGGKGSGKGPGQSQVRVPEVSDLTQPVGKPNIALPKGAAQASNTVATDDKKLIGALMAHLAEQSNVPATLQSMMCAYREGNAKTEGKLLHQQVARRTEARTALQKLAGDRRMFMDAWAEYVAGVADMFKQQVSDMQETLQEFRQAEESWQQQLLESTSFLAKNSGVTEPAAGSAESMQEDDAAVSEDAAENARREIREEKLRTSQLELIQALDKAKAAAEGQRAGSRMPRRQGKGGAKDEVLAGVESLPQQAGH